MKASVSLPAIKQNSNNSSPGVEKKVIYKPFQQKLTFICKFCGGKSCKHENYLTNPNSAIKGLNSDWVTSDILAMQRPSTRIIKEFDIPQVFKEKGINAIFNLQEPGEHPSCGDGIHPASGFSYFPEEFYEHGIYFFNFCWRDMTAPDTDVILRILKQMSFSLMNGNKIAIHCHAGRGRTGLIIAAWLIYHEHMTAKEAIKHVRSKRKGCIQSKSQEEILFKLEKEIKESRMIFHPSPKFKLEDYLLHQKKLLPLLRTSEVRFVPNLVLICLERLETLLTSNLCTALDIALAFVSPNDDFYSKGLWNANHDKSLKALKDRINSGHLELSEIDDPRYLVQALLDYFDNFVEPAISNKFIDAIHDQVHTTDKLTKETKDNFFKSLDKKEFLLMECFAKFFSKLADDEKLVNYLKKAVLRLCISLVLERKKWDKLFFKRSIIKEHSGNDKVTQLHVFLLKWIENFSQSFTENYMVVNSPLRLNEKRVSQRMGKARPSTYMARVLMKEAGGASPFSEASGDSSPKSLRNNSPFRQQAIQEGKLKLDKDGFDSVVNDPEEKEILSPGSPQSGKISGEPSSAGLDQNSNSKRGSLEPRVINLTSGANYSGGDSSPGHQGRSSIYTGSPERRQQPRISFFAQGSNPFVEEDTPDGAKTNIHKNYQDFFAKNTLIAEENEHIGATEQGEGDGGEEGQDQEQNSRHSRLSSTGEFDSLLERMQGLSVKKQTLMMEKLSEMIKGQ